MNEMDQSICYSGVEYGGCVMDANQLIKTTETDPDLPQHSNQNHLGQDQGKGLAKCQ